MVDHLLVCTGNAGSNNVGTMSMDEDGKPVILTMGDGLGTITDQAGTGSDALNWRYLYAMLAGILSCVQPLAVLDESMIMEGSPDQVVISGGTA